MYELKEKAGVVVPRTGGTLSRMGLGFEKLDRKVFDPEKAYPFVKQSGTRWVRLQSGWQRTERQPGVYDFSWLDVIVDSFRSMEQEPWICLCYGNDLYDEEAKTRFGAVGIPPIKDEKSKQAWMAYVKAIVKHFSGRVTWWEIWNEPDIGYSWFGASSAEEYAEFAVETALAIREASAEAKVIAGALGWNVMFLDQVLSKGRAKFFDAITYHIYSSNEMKGLEYLENLREIVQKYNPKLELIQGEGGAQSRGDGAGALHGQAWTVLKQAKAMARHAIIHLWEGVKFYSYFSCMDMAEALNGRVGDAKTYKDYGYFGVVGATFDEEGRATGEYAAKESFHTLQVLANLFREDVTPCTLVKRICNDFVIGSYGNFYYGEYAKDLVFRSFKKANGSCAICYWKPVELLSETFEGAMNIIFAPIEGDIKLVDVLDGSIYKLTDKEVFRKENGEIEIKELPVFDRPLMITFGDFIEEYLNL